MTKINPEMPINKYKILESSLWYGVNMNANIIRSHIASVGLGKSLSRSN